MLQKYSVQITKSFCILRASVFPLVRLISPMQKFTNSTKYRMSPKIFTV